MSQLFLYRGREQNGKVITGILRADSGVAAEKVLLQNNNYVITDIRPAGVAWRSYSYLKSIALEGINRVDLALYCRQFATMVEAGVPITSALKVLAQQTENKKLTEVTLRMVDFLREGKTLTQAVEYFHDVFPELFGRLVDVGETSGNLGIALDQLSTHFEKEYYLREKIKSTLFYPTLVFCLALVTTSVLVFFVLPQLVDIMVLQAVEVPLATRSLLIVANFIYTNWALIPAAILLCLLALKYFLKTEKGNDLADNLKLTLPVIGHLYKMEITCRFCRNLAILLRCGVPIIKSLEIVESVVGNRVLAEAIKDTEVSLSAGAFLSEPLARNNVLPPMVIQMIKVGEESGALDALLDKAADFYEKEVVRKLEQVGNYLEPVLILFVGGIVAIVLFSIIMPILEVVNTI